MKKRSGDGGGISAMDPSLRLELWLAKSRLPSFFQRYNNNGFLDSESVEIPNNVIKSHEHDGHIQK